MTEGWTWLSNAPKWHYFRECRSLCGRWICFGDELINELHPDDQCKACTKKRNKELEFAANS